ncbi:nitroreductase family protein [Cohnella sp. GbtcB17]|uniref:nitroreductase family protein n=1 Tax=Cohnella sp. GbtcB17 TaxID=2824762 RepID=UPI001C30E3B4|nr:nitroreductase family protein [Cohnella sp. GbtcB17]
MNWSKTIRERRSVRRYSSRPVAQETIDSLLNEAAHLYRAEGDGASHWRSLCYRTPEARHRLADSMIAKIKGSTLGKLLPGKMIDLIKKQATDTPAHLVFIAESGSTQRQSDENYAAVCSIMQNVQLLGWELGIGMLWYTDQILNSAAFEREIGLREGERFAGILSMGYYEKVPRARKRTPAEQKWTIVEGDVSGYADHLQVSSRSVLALLNDAVWAPNDGLREPWRFIYAGGGEAADRLRALNGDAAAAFLLVVAKEESDSHKREEDYAAVCCLIQNFQLLAASEPWPVRRTMPEWIYDPEHCKPFGVRPQERIVAVLALGGDGRDSRSTPSSKKT